MSLVNPDPSKLFDADKIEEERKGPIPDRQLDAKCAEILGWEPGSSKLFSTSLDACRELLEWVWVHDRSKAVSEFELRLIGFRNQTDTVGFLLTTPRQIAEAFVECFGGKDDSS